ncbi:tyrosine-type recombinase/integrase [Sulfurimonas aquatica]|uniref:Tyrosine-type recombinase/integrase n=1 Tax=Sulfurimonas aquatica TaxID=2672570 RepID=A0A975AZ08_9BACT|nr:site-specific integrase [Sulfurimonas aquatica]QSZ41206.1 tyrosine-type recombinase/integrase [Sulfurimonas aquatica]
MAMIKSKKFPGVYSNILKNGDTTYYCGYNNTSGKWRRVKVGNKSHGITENYANNKRIEYINITRLGEDPLAHKKNKQQLKLNAIAESYFQYLLDSGKKDTYNPQNRYNLHVKEYIGGKSINHLTKADILTIKTRLLSTKSKATTKHVISLVSTIINHAITSENIRFNSHNICDGLMDDLKLDNARINYLTQENIIQLLDAIKDDEELDLFTRLSLSTGARLNSIVNLTAKSFSGSNISIYDFKSQSTYKSHVSESLLPNIKETLKGLKPNDYVIGRSDKIFNSRTIQGRLKKHLDKLFNIGLDPKDAKNRIVVHSLRHTFASLLVIAGTPLYNVMRLMNHASMDMTMRYAHLAPESGKDAINNMLNFKELQA